MGRCIIRKLIGFEHVQHGSKEHGARLPPDSGNNSYALEVVWNEHHVAKVEHVFAANTVACNIERSVRAEDWTRTQQFPRRKL